MKSIANFIVEKTLVVQFILVLLTLIGLTRLLSMNREAFPNVALDKVVIEAPLPGATPEEIERLIAIPIEKKLRSVTNIDKVRSYNLENVSVIMVFLIEGVKNTKKVVDDIKDAVDSAELPGNAIKPTVREITTEKQEVISLSLSLKKNGSNPTEDYRKLRDTAKAFEDRLIQLKNVADIEKIGYRNREFLVEVNPDALNAKEIGLNTILNVLGSRNINVPSGTMKINGTEYLLRTKGDFEEAKDMINLPVLGNEIGFSTLLKDVAKVFDTFEEEKTFEKLNGKHSIILRVWKTEQADIIVTADSVKKLVESVQNNYPEIEISVFEDKSKNVRRQLGDLILNFETGLVLVLLSLFFVLGFRLSVMISAAIVFIFFIAFIFFKQIGITINTISIFGMVMVLGMMVDNSIVVVENTYRLMQDGRSRTEAILQTFRDVLIPLLVSFLVISAAFIPLLFMSGIIGKFIFGIPAVVLITLVSSLLFALVFLPNWLNIFLPQKLKVTPKKEENIEEKEGIFGFVIRAYKATIGFALKHRVLVLIAFNIIFFSTLFLAGKFLPFIMFPPGSEEDIEIKTWMPIGSTLQKNLETMEKMEPTLISMAGKDFDYLRSRIGIHESPIVDPKPGQEVHRSHLTLKLVPSADRLEWKDARVLVQKIRNYIEDSKKSGLIDKDMFYDVNARIKGPPVGKPVSLEIRGPEYKSIKEIAELYISELKKIDGVFDIRIDLEQGKEEFRFHVKDDFASRTDISARDIARTVRTAYNGEIASSISKGEDKINILVRFPESERHSMDSLNKVKVENRNRRLIPLEKVTNFVKAREYSMINRQDLLRVVRLEASVDTKKTTSLFVNRKLQSTIKLDKYPEYSVIFGGEQEDAQKSFKDLGISMLFAVAVIFGIFVIYFNSVGTTLVIIGSIPFGIVGVLFALMTHGMPLSFMSTLAIVALSGSIVANTLILITFINELRSSGMSLDDAIINGGAIRLRPIFLTTLSTVIGLIPSAYGIPTLDQFVQPLSLAFGWGLFFATAVTLVVVPVLYRIKEDFKSILLKIPFKKINH
ncbi:MAG: efflux RND transporter permease subunit [Leptospiraceae bacterium]|nr:efflux RND transporter permease subunit [Leptospiraceae bacterium]